MSEPKDGGSAFPKYSITIPPRAEGESPITIAAGYGQGGMSLRDWFAGQALSGMTGKQVSCEDILKVERAGGITALCSAAAYEFADAMLKERSK